MSPWSCFRGTTSNCGRHERLAAVAKETLFGYRPNLVSTRSLNLRKRRRQTHQLGSRRSFALDVLRWSPAFRRSANRDLHRPAKSRDSNAAIRLAPPFRRPKARDVRRAVCGGIVVLLIPRLTGGCLPSRLSPSTRHHIHSTSRRRLSPRRRSESRTTGVLAFRKTACAKAGPIF